MTVENETPVPEEPMGLPTEDDIPSPTDTESTSTPEATDNVVPTLPNTQVEATEDVGLPVEDEPATEKPDAEDVEAVVILMRHGVNPNAELSKDPSHPLNPKQPWRPGEGLYIVPCTSEEFNTLVENVPRLDPTQSEQGMRWREAVAAGQEVMPRAGTGLAALLREASMWRQSVSSNGEGSAEIAAGRPKIGERKGDAPLVGEEALQHMQMMLGTGQVTRIPLWHSGIWVNLKAPTEDRLLELDRRIAAEKIALGRATNGLAFSNMSIYHNSFLFNFALSMVFDCSIGGFTVDSLKRKILLTDLPTLLWGLLCTIYPNGYRYQRPCINDPSKCTHVVEEILDISKLCWTDNTALTQSQRNHMVRKTAKFTDIELTHYQEQHRYADKGTVLLKDYQGNKTVAELRVPTLADYEASGFAWVEGIVTSADQAFGSQLGGEERNEYILDQARATSLRQYAHWINRITFNGDKYIDDRSTLESMIGQLTGDRVVFENLLEGVRKFIDEATISQIAIPSYKCPACQLDQVNPEESKHPHLIPLDIGTIFFILLGQRTSLLLDTAII